MKSLIFQNIKRCLNGLIILIFSLSFSNLLLAAQSTATQALQQQVTVDPKDVQRFGNAIQIIKSYYVEPTPDQKLFDNAIRGMLGGLDPHSAYLDADDLRELKDATSGAFSGIGIEIIPEAGYLKVVAPLDDSPAQKAGIKAGDIIVRVDNTLIKNMTLREAVKKMRGKSGTPVVLTILRKGETKPLVFKVERNNIQIQSIKGQLITGGYGYVRISTFQTNTAKDLEKTVEALRKQADGKLKGLILDLRNNPGGLLSSAAGVTDDFLNADKLGKNKLIVYTKGRLPDSKLKITATSGDILDGAPLVVLINEGSASGSEIVAGALQDHKRALVVGTPSFGKGSVQTVIPLDETSALKLTTALYYTPKGRSIQAAGIVPDTEVEDLKFTSANKSDQSLSFIKEAELKGHLSNGSEIIHKAQENNTAQSKDIQLSNINALTPAELATSDYQLFEALNLLKAMVALKK